MRREFLAAAASLPVVGFSDSPAPAEPREAVPAWPSRKHFVWTGLSGKATHAERLARYAALKGHGIHGVFVSGFDDAEFDAIREAGLELHVWMWTTNRGEAWIRENHPDWYMVSRSGKSCLDQPPYVDYYRWVSPVIPGVRKYLTEKVEEIARHPAVHGVHLDYVRYPDVILPKALWKTYGLDQTEELADYDFCYSDHTRKAFRERTGRDPIEIKDPAHDQEWLHFRYDSVTRLVRELKVAAQRHGKALSAAVFPTPRLARSICRQAWDAWPLDFAAPMIYHSFYEEPEAWIGTAVLEDVQAVAFPVVAGLYMPAFGSEEAFRAGLRHALRRGASGISLFGGVSEAQWRVFESATGA